MSFVSEKDLPSGISCAFRNLNTIGNTQNADLRWFAWQSTGTMSYSYTFSYAEYYLDGSQKSCIMGVTL